MLPAGRDGILVVSGSDGRIEKAQNLAQLFAGHGYAVLALCYFGLDGTPVCLSRIPLECIERAPNWMRAQPDIIPGKTAIYGRSKGGELALLANSLFPEIRCVIANTPSCYVMEGLTAGRRNSGQSSWEYRGQPLPFLKLKPAAVLCLSLIHI